VKLPKSLAAFSRELKADLNALEKDLESAGHDARQHLTRVMGDASHQLGVLEARGQKQWASISKRAAAQVQETVDRVKQAVKSRTSP
jgi:uncharacterized alpha-E superfamily protein